MVDFKYKNVTFNIIEYDYENSEYVCNFRIKLTEDFMKSNIPEDMFIGSIIKIYDVKKNEEIPVIITTMVYSDHPNLYGLSIPGSCTFQLFSRSARSGIYESYIV